MFDDEVEQSEKVNFDKALEVANRLCENDQVLNDKSALILRSTFRKEESQKLGRVHLSVFYDMSLHSHWRFNERDDTLQDLRVLEDQLVRWGDPGYDNEFRENARR